MSRPRTNKLSPREKEIALVISHGRTIAETARELGISRAAVDNALRYIFLKLNVDSTSGIAFAMKHDSDSEKIL